MSRMLDALENKSSKKQAHPVGIQDEIAKTYFRSSSAKSEKKKQGWVRFLPWAVTIIVALVALAAIISKSSIDIKVRLLGEIPVFGGSKAGVARDTGVFLVEGGEPQADIVRNAYFSGDSKTYSLSKKEDITLYNSRGPGWANYTIELKEPVDLNSLDIKYTAKGNKGDESLVLVISDGDRRVYRMEKDLSSSLTNEWKNYTINFRSVKGKLDLSSISVIKFEFGSLTAGNYPGAVIHLKDIYLAKTRRLKWL